MSAELIFARPSKVAATSGLPISDARSMYLLTTTAEAFSKRGGYVAAARQTAPAEIRATREFVDTVRRTRRFWSNNFK
jgi:hypothetical protein